MPSKPLDEEVPHQNHPLRASIEGRTQGERSSETVMVWIPALVEVGLGVAALAPFLIHRISVSAWRKKGIEYPISTTELPPITVLLPVWNEALILEKKLDNLAAQNIRFSVLMVDSASTDTTLSTAKAWLKKNPKAFDSSKLIEMEKRLGKTEAVRQAIASLEKQDYHGLICMTDADAMLPPNALSRLQGWFSDRSIGAVGAKALRHQAQSGERTHRSMFELLREGESARDSTPFLEGSCICLLYTSPSPRDATLSRMPSSA